MIIYIEKYDKIEGFLLGDFINKEDYYFFCKSTGYENYVNDERTMLLIEDLRFNKGIIPKEGSIYQMPYELLENFEWKKEPSLYNNELHKDVGISNIISFRTKANFVGASFFKKALYYGFTHLKGTWHGMPCGLEGLSDNIKVRVKNVGQGNWNEIYDNNICKVIYDIGSSIFSTNLEIRNFVLGSKKTFSDKPSLIISHWDIDHYQCLFEVDKSDLVELCCVFVPDKLITETSKRAFRILVKNCNYINTINESPNRVIKRRISLEVIAKDRNYAFFRGEKSCDINKSGLALAIWNDTGCAILAGDHHYPQVFCDIYKEIPSGLQVNIVTPHHGGEAGKITIIPRMSALAELAVTSTGNNNYGHPKDEIRRELSKMGFRWLRTDFAGKDVEIEL